MHVTYQYGSKLDHYLGTLYTHSMFVHMQVPLKVVYANILKSMKQTETPNFSLLHGMTMTFDLHFHVLNSVLRNLNL